MKNVKYEPRLVAIGGGTGLSTLLRGLKKYTSFLTAIVAVTDDGGSSGTLRRELGVLPPGDIRNCLVALSGEENLMAKLFQYRFPAVGSLAGHSFGNLFLTAMSALAGGFDRGIARASEVLAIRGQVLPVTLSSVTLQALMSDGKIVKGESKIARTRSRIDTLTILPAPPPADPRVIEAIRSADAVILGPGSLYTSIIANLLVKGVVEAIRGAKVPKIYVSNLMTQPGETAGFSFSNHMQAIEKHGCRGLVNHVVVNSERFPRPLERKYAKEGACPVTLDCKGLKGIKVVKAGLISPRAYARHDPDKLARVIMQIVRTAANR